MRLLVMTSILALSLNSYAGNCLCSFLGASKRECKESITECKTMCDAMNPSGINPPPSMSWSPGACPGSATPADGSVRVDGRPTGYWTDSKIDIQYGEVYSINAPDHGGMWHTNPGWSIEGANGHPTYRGNSNYLLPGAPEQALIGKVGDGPAFLIGSKGQTPPNSVGRLYLTPNDEPAGFGDNSGWMWVTVKRM